MRAAREGEAAAPAPAAAWRVGLALAAVVLLAWTLFFGGDSSDDKLTWLGCFAIVLAAVAVAGALLARVRWPSLDRAGLAFVGLLTAFVLWNGFSVAWSIQPDRSWSYTNRGLVYLAFACIGVFLGSLVPRAPRAAAGALAVLLAGVLGWALLGKIFPSLFSDYGRLARLRAPIGYWNALALVGDAAVALGLWIARPRSSPRVRVGGVVLIYAAVAAILLAYSRAGVLVGVVLVAGWLLFERDRLEALAAVTLGSGVAALVAGWAVTRPGIADDGQAYSTRVRDGAIFGVVLLLGLAVVVWAAFALIRYDRENRIPDAQRRELVRYAVWGAAALAVILFAASTISAGGPSAWLRARVHEFTTPISVTQSPHRVTSFSSNHRWTWWKESWDSFTKHPLAGTGTGSFALVHRPLRRTSLDVTTEPHDIPLQFLGETGIVGFLLLMGVAGAAVVAIHRALRRLDREDASAGRALALGALAYTLWALVDFDWDFVAVTGPLFLSLGLLAASGMPRRAALPARRPLWAAGTVAIALAAAFSLVSPWLAERRVDASVRALERGNVAAAIAAARDAHSLNPLALEPLLVWAGDEAVAGNLPEAKRLYAKALKLQPHDAASWYEFGAFELEIDCYPKLAYEYLNRAYALDPFGPTAELDEARRLVNELAKSSNPRRSRCGRP
jgi:O-antigen ligase/polysaccharide polymerase Wzy-like membrane protein